MCLLMLGFEWAKFWLLLGVLVMAFSGSYAALYYPYTNCVGMDTQWQKGKFAKNKYNLINR